MLRASGALVAFVMSGFRVAVGVSASCSPLEPAERWEALFDHLRSTESFSAPFREERHQSFRRTPQNFSGVLRAHRERGVAFHYRQRRERLFLIRDNTLYDATGGTPEAVSMPGEARSLIVAVGRLVQWDQNWIEENFRLAGEFANAAWRLTLDPSTPELEDLLMEIVLEGARLEIKKIIIHQTPNRRIEFFIEDIELDPSWSERDLDTYFPPVP